MREGRSPHQIGRKGLSNHRWSVGGKPCLRRNQWGWVVAWACDTANVADNTFQWLIRQFDERMLVLSDTGFHAAEGDPAHLKLCQRGAWQDRLLVETVLSMLTPVSHFKQRSAKKLMQPRDHSGSARRQTAPRQGGDDHGLPLARRPALDAPRRPRRGAGVPDMRGPAPRGRSSSAPSVPPPWPPPGRLAVGPGSRTRVAGPPPGPSARPPRRPGPSPLPG